MNDRTYMSGMPDLKAGDRKRLVLIVEDEYVNLMLLSAYLENEYEVLQAENALGYSIRAVRYCIVMFVEVGLYPMAFRIIGNKKKSETKEGEAK